MSDFIGRNRRRNQTLLVVEGNHEKNQLFWLLYRCFPELSIRMDDVWIYGTNIYMLYEDIVKEYGSDWAKEQMDIDLPFVISKKKTPENIRYKNDFTNIILVFDYERHDPNFSEKKIKEMQESFGDVADMGKLYINYPMIESYQHLVSVVDPDYEERKVLVSLQPGRKYKDLVAKESCIGSIVMFPHRVDELLMGRFCVEDAKYRQMCCEEVLNLKNLKTLETDLDKIFEHGVPDIDRKTLIYQMKDWICKVGYVSNKQNYWEYMRSIFSNIIYQNICKANRIVNGYYHIEYNQCRACYDKLEHGFILREQNRCSSGEDGYIWVLNTSVLVVSDYNFSLVQNCFEK